MKLGLVPTQIRILFIFNTLIIFLNYTNLIEINLILKMKINLIVVGKTKSYYLQDGEADYTKRLKNTTVNFQDLIIPNNKNSSNLSKKEIKEKEGRLILDSIKNSDYVILLDDKGITLSSVEFSEFINQKMVSSNNELVFVMGGALDLVKVYISEQILKLSFIQNDIFSSNGKANF